MKFDKEQKLAKWYLLSLLGIALVSILYAAAGFWVLPAIAKSVLETNLSAQLHRDVTIESIKINPYELSFSIRGLAIREAHSADNFLAFDELYAVLQGGSIVERALILREVRLSAPYVNISRMKDGRFNFSDLLETEAPAPEPLPEKATGMETGTAPGPQSEAPPERPSPPSGAKDERPSPFRFSIHNVQIANGKVDYFDEAKGEKESIENIHLELPLISSMEEGLHGWVGLTAAARINQSPLSITAKGKPFSDELEAVLDIQAERFELTHYLGYLPPELKVQVRSGAVDAQATVTYSRTEAGPTLKITGGAAITGFEAVDANDSKLITLPRVDVAFESLEPLAGKLHLSTLRFQSPALELWRNKDGKLNLESLVANRDAGETGPAGSGKESAFLIAVDEVEIVDGRIGFIDRALEPEFRTSLETIDLEISQFTSAPGSKAAVKFSAKTEAGETLGMEGSLAVAPLQFEGAVGISEIALAKYAPYYRKQVLFDVSDGRLDLKTSVRLAMAGKEPNVKLSGLKATASSLKLKKRDEASHFIEIPLLEVKDGAMNLAGREITLGEVASENGKIASFREKNGQLSLQTLVPAAPDVEPGKDIAHGTAAAQQRPWKFLLGKVSLKNYLVTFEDRMMSEPVAFLLDLINLEGENILPEKESKSKLAFSCRVNEGGAIQATGEVATAPLFADLKLTLKDIGILPIQPYLPEDVKLKPTSGRLAAAGNLLLGKSGENDLGVSYTGELSLTDFATVDKIKGEDFFFCKNLDVTGADAAVNPFRASIKKIAVKDFFSRVTISPEGNINILQVLGSDTESKPMGGIDQKQASPGKKQAAVKSEAAPAKQADVPRPRPQTRGPEKSVAPPAAIKIDEVALQNGEIAFSDNHIKPNFRAELLDVGGTITGLAPGKDLLADVNLRGKLYRSSPLEITGKINPFPGNLFADLTVHFKNIDLTRWNPYAQKYAGYTLKKGNLHLDLKYLIVKQKLDSQNNIVFDRLTLGEKVNSSEATTLPVKFAISLLQDSKGEIQLGIPVSGNLDDPQFSLGQVIINTIKNILMKAVTAPFALLGALVPQGVTEIDRVEMDYATGKITETGVKKLDAVAKILHERPNLELDLQASVEVENGKEALTQNLFEKKLKTQKMKEVIKKGGVAVSVDQVTVGPDEVPKYLKQAYDEEFPKEGFLKLDFGKKPSPEEMKTQLLTKIQVTDDDLRSLAYDWALEVKEYLLEAGKVEPRRLFLLEPSIGGQAQTTASKGTGVNLQLK